MLDRVAALITSDLTGLWAGLFTVSATAFCDGIRSSGLRAGFSINDRDDSEEMLDGVIAALGVDPKEKAIPEERGAGGRAQLSTQHGAESR